MIEVLMLQCKETCCPFLGAVSTHPGKCISVLEVQWFRLCTLWYHIVSCISATEYCLYGVWHSVQWNALSQVQGRYVYGCQHGVLEEGLKSYVHGCLALVSKALQP